MTQLVTDNSPSSTPSSLSSSLHLVSMTVKYPSPAEGSHHEGVEQHPKYWNEDGTLVIQVQQTLFKVSADLLSRHSPVILKGVGSVSDDGGSSYVLVWETFESEPPVEGKAHRTIRTTEEVQSKDFEVLLQTLLDE